MKRFKQKLAGLAMALGLFAALTCAGEVVSSAAGGWFAVDARAVKDTTLEGGVIVAGETNLVLQCSPSAWGAAVGGSGVTVAYRNDTTGDAGTIAENTTAESVDWTPNTPGTFVLTHTVATSGDPVVLSTTFAVPGVTFTPTVVGLATAAVYANGAEMVKTGDSYLLGSNATAIVVYTADSDYYFADGSTVCTNTLDTTKNPATVEAPAAPAKPSVKVGHPAQRYPWNGIVDVPYRLKNWPAGGAGRQVKFTVTVDKTTLDGGTVAPAAGGQITGTHAIDFRALKLPADRGVSAVKAEIVTE